MTILLVGLNHQTASVALREQCYVTGDALAATVAALRGAMPACVVLSTCNRLEVYGVAQNAIEAENAVVEHLSTQHGIPANDLMQHLYLMHGDDAANHLMRVATGLDSMVLGEVQILGQVTKAHEYARANGTLDAALDRLFTTAIHAGKRARTETTIGRHINSIGHAAAILAQSRAADKRNIRLLVVGAGEMAQVAAKAFWARGVHHIRIINRTRANADALAHMVEGRASDWKNLHDELAWADVVVSATGAPRAVICTEDVPPVDDRERLYIDLAVPRDIDEAVGELPNIRLHDIDDMRNVVDGRREESEAAVPAVEAIIDEEATRFFEWRSSREVVPVIKGLRAKVTELARTEVENALGKLSSEDDHALVEKLAHRIVNKVLHEPTTRLREHAANGEGTEYAAAIRELFALDEDGQIA